MKWFDKWFRNKCKAAWESEDDSVGIQPVSAQGVSAGKLASNIPGSHDNGIHFVIYGANGGHIVETSKYDRVKDRHHTGLHIIRDEDDIGQEISKILTLESLR
jgi:hypothetical protein